MLSNFKGKGLPNKMTTDEKREKEESMGCTQQPQPGNMNPSVNKGKEKRVGEGE